MNQNLACSSEDNEKRIKAKVSRYRRFYKNLAKDKTALVEGLVRRMAALEVFIEDAEQDMAARGTYEYFQQSPDVEGYERTRPIVNQHASWVAQYQRLLKQLLAELPEAEAQKDDLQQFMALRG